MRVLSGAAGVVKSEKYTPASRRQLRRLQQLGCEANPRLTQHAATRRINAAVVTLRLGRGQRLPPLGPPP